MSTDKQADPKNFETALRRLEEVVSQLEKGVDDLDRIVHLYEEGTQLVTFCNKRLTEVETKIEELTRNLIPEQSNEDKHDE